MTTISDQSRTSEEALKFHVRFAIGMSAGVKVVLAVFAGLTASALARLSYGPSSVETYTGGFVYWLNYYSGIDFGVIIAGIVLIVNWDSPNRTSIAATTFLSVTVVAAALATFGVFGR
jgi:hypothetical protein